MNVIAHGIDLVECGRIAEAVERHGAHFLERVLTQAERDYVAKMVKPTPHIAGRFAAKEAVLKMLGTGWRGAIAWTDIEVLNDVYGQPHVTLGGRCAELARDKGIDRVLLSISHTENNAMASAIGVSA